MAEKRVVFDITPQTFVRATVNDRIFFKIPRNKLRPAGLKRLMRLERYNHYKIDLNALAKAKKFELPEQGAHVTFFIPVPKSWAKYKKADMHMRLHQTTPDVDNLTKAMFDSLMAEDKHIADIHITKRWVNSDTGWIEVIIHTPLIRSSDTIV
jgi:Holliday junction resolvase RusA-like endonuclease